MPKHAVIVAHPDPDSFTLSVARTYCAAVEAAGQTAVLRDLYRIGFDPVLKISERPSDAPFAPAPDVAAELELIAGSGAFVLVYPIWFGTPPAMLKGYIDRVLGAGFSPRALHNHLGRPAHPLLGGRQLLSFSSSGSTRQWLADQGAWVSLQTIFDGYLARAFWMDTPDHVHFDSIHEGLSEAEAAAHLETVERRAGAMCRKLAATAEPPAAPAGAAAQSEPQLA
jgi:NAD(P)H dehydrogenase (quinone)